MVRSASNNDLARLNDSGAAKKNDNLTGYPTILAKKQHQGEPEYASVD